MRCMPLLVVLLMLLLGCSETRTFRGDMSFTPEERAEIERANAWLVEQEDVGGEPFSIVWDLPHESAPVDFTIVCGERDSYAVTGFTADTGRVELSPASNRARLPILAILAAHEFAHMRGIGHHTGTGVMNSHISTELVWTESDREAAAAR